MLTKSPKTAEQEFPVENNDVMHEASANSFKA